MPWKLWADSLTKETFLSKLERDDSIVRLVKQINGRNFFRNNAKIIFF